MAHFARIENGIVREVIVVSNDDAPDEATGLAFIASIGLTGDFVQTSYNAATNGFRGKYAGIGDVWDGTTFTTPGGQDA